MRMKKPAANRRDWLSQEENYHQRIWIMHKITLIAIFAVGAVLSGCAADSYGVPSPSDLDSRWRQDDAYGRGQRGTAPNGGSGTVHQRHTPRAPVTPN
jgi:hypothetical protein